MRYNSRDQEQEPLTSVKEPALRSAQLWKFCSRMEAKNRPIDCSYLEKLTRGHARKQEWMDVYKAIFSDDINCWKEAKDTMLVWQARFVSVLLLPQTKYYQKQTMHDLKRDIGPQHLNYYWENEWKKMMQVMPEGYSLPLIPQDNWQKFLKLLKRYSTLVIPKSRMAEFNRKHLKRTSNDLKWALENMYAEDSQECIKALISHLLIPKAMPNLVQQLQSDKNWPCGCFFKKNIISGVGTIISSLHLVEGSTELLVSHLIKKGSENPKVASEWIRLIVGSVLGLSVFYNRSEDCRNHSLKIETKLYVEWKLIVLELLEAEAEWATDIAMRIMTCPTTGFGESQRKSIDELLQIMKGKSEDNLKEAEEPTNKSKDGVYTIDDIVEAAREHSVNVLAKMERLKASLIFPGKILVDIDAPLGVLPHQRDNTAFYKELLLQHADTRENSPLTKRRKT
nr:uncharacterized protein LOC128698569 [Cherax quadricarinatus]